MGLAKFKGDLGGYIMGNLSTLFIKIHDICHLPPISNLLYVKNDELVKSQKWDGKVKSSKCKSKIPDFERGLANLEE